MEKERGIPEFRIDTEIIVGDVDLDLAGERNRIIESWRQGEIESEDAHRRLLELYWSNQRHLNPSTGHYLMSMSVDFPLEAGMDFDVAEEIYQDTMREYTE